MDVFKSSSIQSSDKRIEDFLRQYLRTRQIFFLGKWGGVVTCMKCLCEAVISDSMVQSLQMASLTPALYTAMGGFSEQISCS